MARKPGVHPTIMLSAPSAFYFVGVGLQPGLENPGTIGLIRRSRQSLLSTGLRLPGSGRRFSARMMSIVPSHGLCNLLRGELAVVAGVQYIARYVCLGFRFGFHFCLPAFLNKSHD